MYKKKLFIIAITAVLALSACGKAKSDAPKGESAVEVTANSKVTEENFRSFPVTDESMFYVDNVEGGVELSSCKSELKDKVIVVPEKIYGKEVVTVDTGAFLERDSVAFS